MYIVLEKTIEHLKITETPINNFFFRGERKNQEFLFFLIVLFSMKHFLFCAPSKTCVSLLYLNQFVSNIFKPAVWVVKKLTLILIIGNKIFVVH